MKFEELGISAELAERLEKEGFREVFEVQKKAIPQAIKEKNIAVRARTGSGKTLAFVIPLIEKQKRAMILTPVRELAIQIRDVIEKISNIPTALIYGGVRYEKQIRELEKAKIVVGTPGRILDLIKKEKIRRGFDYFVLDEADRMLDMGFIEDVKKIMHYLNAHRIWLFSATLEREVLKVFGNENFEIIEIGKEMPEIEHKYVHANRKIETIRGILNGQKALIFCNTKAMAKKLAYILKTPVIHGDMSQNAREKSLERFRNGAKYLVATDVAARGIDIPEVEMIINFDVPRDAKTYLHRAGRTARAGKNGKVINIVSSRDQENFRKIANFLGLGLSPL